MRKPIQVALIVLSLWQAGSCTLDKAPPPSDIDCTTVDAALNTYNLSVKAIVDFNCAYSGCHDAASFSGSVNLEGFGAVKNAFQNQDVLCTVKHGSGCLSMPLAAPKLADSLITKLQCWAENGYPQ